MNFLKKTFFNTAITAIIVSAVFLASCATTKQQAAQKNTAESEQISVEIKIAENAQAVSGSITESDKYGNLATDITVEDFEKAGITAGDVAVVDLCGKTYSIPVVTSYSDVDIGSFLIRLSKGKVFIAINHGNCASRTGATSGTPVTFILSEKAGYLSEFTIRHLEKSENRSDFESDAIFANARAVTTTGIGKNKLYRSCNPSLTDARAPYADAFAKSAGIKTAINLANTKELFEENQKKLLATYYSSLVANGNVIFLNMGVSVIEKAFAEKFADGIRFMIKHDGPYLIHCDEGKDRAGFVNAVLEALMGASTSEIKDDYMKSFENYFNVKQGSEQYEHISINIIKMLESVNNNQPVTDKNIKAVAEKYLTETLGLSKAEVKKLKQQLK